MNRVNASEQVVCRKSKGLRNQNILTEILSWVYMYVRLLSTMLI